MCTYNDVSHVSLSTCHRTGLVSSGYCVLYRISQDRLSSLQKWYKAEGLVPKEKKSGGRAHNT